MDIKLADGTIVRNVPEGVTPEEVQAKINARKSRDKGIGGMDLVKSLASGVNRLGSSLAGMADNSIIGDTFRAIDGTPMREQVNPSPFDTPEIAAKKEKLAEEYLKAEPITKKVQGFFEDNAGFWNKEQSAPARNIREYVNSGKGFVNTAERYMKYPSAGVMSAVESLPMMAPLILTKNAPATTQLAIGALHESAANAEDARQGALEDAKRSGATAAQALEASNLAYELASAATMATMPINASGGVNALRRLTGRTTTEGAKHGFSQIPKQMLAEAGQEFIQEGSSQVAQNIGAQQTYNEGLNVFKGSAVAGLHGAVAGGIMGGAMGTLAVPEGATPEADPTPDSPQPTPQASPDAQAAQARKAELDAIRQQRPLTPEEQDDADVADAILARNAPQQPPAQGGQPAGTPAPQPAPSQQAGAPIVGATPQPAGAPVGSNIPQPPEPPQPAPGLSGVVQRHTQSAAPALDTVFGDAIKGNQVPDFTGLAQQTGLDRNSLVDQFNAKRTEHVRKQGLMDLAEQGDLNALRSAVSGITVDPQQQDQLIEEAVSGNEQRKAEALAASQQQGLQAQQQAQQAAQQQADKDKYDQTYGKMLDEAVAALEGGQTEVKAFLPIKKKYSASGLNTTDVNGVIEHAKQVIAEKQQKAARHERAVIEALPYLQSGDEASAVLAMEQAGVTDDADVQSVLKEANKRIRQDSKKPAGTQSVPVVQPADQLASAVAEVKAAQAAGKKVNLATIAKKHGVTIMDVAKGVAARPEQAAPKAKPSQPLALPAPQGPATTGEVMVSRNGKVMSQAEADALAAASDAEKKQMRRDMAEEAGNPTGIPTGMKPKVEKPARAEQKAVLPNLILRTDGKPFPDTKQATRVLASKKLEDTHEVVSVEGGKAIAPKKSVTAKNQVDPEKDDILTAIAKLGGIDRAQAKSQGVDPADFSRRAGGIQFVFRKNGGKELDRMAEALSEMGYPVTNENGDYTINALLDSLDAALRGSSVGTPMFHTARAQADYEARYAEEAAQAAIDATFDSPGNSSEPDWMLSGADDTAASILDSDITPIPVITSELEGIENERRDNGQTEGFGQEADTRTAVAGAAASTEPVAGRRSGGQQEGQGSAGQDSGVQAGFQLASQTEAERLAEEQRQAADLETKRQADEAVRLKAQADKDREGFTLTGSNRPADVAMAAGQNDLFAPKTRGEKAAAKNIPKTEDTISDADYAQVVEAAKYLKDIVYSLDNLLGDDKRLLLSLSSPLGKSGRDTILMDTFGIDRNLAHTIHNRMDDSKPHKLRDIDMTDALDTFPMLKKIIDDAKEELRLRDERKAAKDIFAPQTRGEKEAEKAATEKKAEPVTDSKADAKQAKFDELSRLTGRSSASIRQAYESKVGMDGKEEADFSLDQQILQEQLKKARDNTPANKKFDSLIATAADSPAKLRDHDIERVLDNAGSRSELVRLRDYLSSLRPDKAEFIADAANDIGGDKGFDMTGSKAAKPEPEPRAIDENGRPTDGKPIIPGDTFRTLSGRTTTPYPKQKGEKYASQWLIDNATAEAEARGDDFNAPIFRRTSILKDGTLTTADSESLNMYLFGEQPAVVPSILKPLISDEDRTPAAIVSPRDSLIDEINAAIKDADGIGLTETSKRLQELNRDVYDRIETPENGRKRLAAIISDMKNPLLSGDWVSLGKGRIVFRWEGMDYGRIEDTRITEDRGDGVSNPWRTSDGALHGTLRQAKKHESDTYTKPRLERDGYIQPEGSEKQKQSADYGSNNKLVTNDRAAEIRAKLKSKLNGSQLNSGFDPEILALGAELAAFHIEAGVRKFADFAKAIAADLDSSVSELRPYLRAWFNGARDMIEDAGLPIEGMDSPEQVRDALAVIDKEIADSKNNGVITPESLQDYVIKQIQNNVSAKFPGGESPLAIREVESTDFSIGEILQAHPAVANRREDPATYKKFAEAAKLVDNGAIRKAIIGTRDIAPFGSRPSRNTQEDQVNARDTGGTSSESGGGNEAPANKGVVLNEQRRTEHSDGFAGQSAGREIEGDATGGARVSGVRPADGGERGNQPVRSGFGQFQPTDDTAGGGQRTGGAESGDTRVQVDRAGSAAVVQAVGSVDPEVTRQKKLAAQRQAESIPVAPGDKENIDATLPFLLDGQREDIYTAEKRFAAKNGHGMLFTNGTGTGKTFLALGTIKRFARQGKGNVLVVVPNDAVIKEWTTSAPALGLTINQLADTKDKGTGVSITTYANFGQNDAIAFRDYDLVVMDEAHNLMQNADAGGTAALSTLRAITRHEEGIRRLTDMQNRDLVDGMAERSKKIFENSENLRGVNKTSGTNGWKLKVETDRLDAELREMRDKWNKAYEDNKRKALSSPRPKALFLSATPFAYEKNVVWAQGYLFDWNEGKPSEENRTRAYNEPDNYERFMIQHFGYRMRYNKLTEPDAKVDRDLMQREFNATLRKSGSLSARMLDVPSDYQRAFALTPNALGTKIDEGLNWLREAEDRKYVRLYDVIAKRFDYLSRQRLLEAMKAESAIPMIQKWHDLGKKVVVFYDFNEGGGFAPFNLGNYKPDGEDPQAFGQLVQDFYAARPDLKDLNTAELPSPLEALLSAFPNAGVYNGRVSKKKRAADMEAFNDDNNRDANLLIVQSAANAGWSAHDKSGKFKRVLINLGMPTAPTKAIQQEGRIYRQGQHPESDSMFVYMNTGTSWERAAFAGTIARRASTAENLAMGEQARGLRDAFIMAFEDSDILEPSLDEGKGSKEKDRSLLKAASPFDRAKSYYFGQLKKTQATKAREGRDYFATPEPVGMKMVEWLGLEGGEKALEPSAGHGAISRWFPDNTENTIVEPSFELISRAALNTNAKQINDTFENLSIVNKYHGIAMNPPFGVGGKTAMEHVDKAFRHLNDGGRIVALIPEGPSADRRFEKWLEAKDEKGKPAHPDVAIRATIRLPAATFERAGTTVSTRIVVIDRIKDDTARSNADSISIDLSQAGDINALFNRIENVSVPKRVTAGAATAADATPAASGQDSALLEAKETTHAIKKIPLYVAALTRRVDGDTYTAISRIAKRHGGYYSKFDKNGAIPGFQFESKEARGKFMDEIVETKFSANASTGPGLTITRAREILSADPVLSKALPFIDIRNSKDGVPEGAEPIGEEGYYHNGRITLFADNIRATKSMTAEERLKWVAFHEVTHRGVANLAESQTYLSELERAGKNPYVKNLAKKIYEARQSLDAKYHVTMEVAIEEALAEISAALRTGNVKQIKEQYGLHFPLAIRGRAKSAIARFFEAVKRIYSKVVGRGLTNDQVAELLRKTHEAGMGPNGTNPSGRRDSFAGESAQTADLSALDKAKQRIAAGEDAEAVRKDTGWFKGADGKMRFEINDADAKLAMDRLTWGEAKDLEQGNTTSLPLGRLLDHPALFAAYPSLENYWVRVIPGMKSASFNPESNTIAIGYDKATKQADLSALLHEIQHAIQENEGFATGGASQDAFADPRMRPGATKYGREAAFKLLAEKLSELKRPDSIEQFARNAWGTDEITPELEASYADYVKLVAEAAASPNIQRAAQEWAAKEWYRRLAGEVEARNTQARANMTGAERRATSPQSTEDVAERDQIVKFSKGEISASSSGDQKVRALFRKVQEAQRFGKGVNGVAPELAFDSRYNPGVDLSGAFATAAEHIGDLVHRAAMPLDEYEAGAGIGPGGASYGLSALREKTSRFLGRVKRGEDLDHIPQASRNAEWNFDPENKFKKASFGSVEDGVALFKTAAQRYADAYKQVPVYTELQQLARDAAIALGEFRHDDLLAALEKIDVIVRIDPRSKKASQARAMESYFALLPDVGNDSSDFSADTADIRYSAPPTPSQPPSRSVFASVAKQWMFQKWTETLGTQLNTAMLEPLFKPTYQLVQRYLQHTSNDAYDAISVAPNLLGRLEDINDYGREIKNIGKFRKINADREAAAVPLFEGTRFDKKVYSDAVLKRVYNLTDDQVAVYREARAAIEASLDSHAKSVITKILLDAGAVEFSDIDALVNRDLPADDYMEELRQRLDADILAANEAIAIQKTALSAAGVTAQDKASIQASIKKGSRRVELLEEAAKRIDSTEDTLSQLKREGYFPLMRWGKYTVTVKDAGGNVVDFRMVETLREKAALSDALTKHYQGQGMTVTSGTMDEGRFKDFRGMSPETLALFAKELGVDNDEAYQEYLKLALPGQSALKRRIHRKGDNGEGIAGFSMDIQRTLASFVMGNARHSARNIYGSAITKSVDSIPGERGDVRGLARNLAEFVTQPDENSTSVSIRNMLFVWNMGASVAFGALNLSQPWMMTLPWLSQFSGVGNVAGIMGKASKTAAIAQKNGTVPQEYYAEYQQAVREGHVDPQNVFMLQGIERGGSGLGSSLLKTVSHGMGMIAAATESYNRKLTLFAALDVAKAKGPQWLKSKGFDSAYAFAKQAIAETQGVYNKGNRPAWARNPLGAIVLVFKQYAINWTEMAVRMGRNHYGDDRMRKGLMMMLGLLFAMAGAMGMPGAEDLKDIAETAMGSAGKPVNIERQMQMTLGKGMADAVMAGPMNALVLNSIGLDMHGRMSMGNIIPGTGAFNPYTSTDAKLSEGISVMGAGTGLLKKGSDAVAAAQDGRFLDAAQSAAPRAVESIMKGSRMLAEGKARDSRGNVLMETTPWDAAAKIIDFQPASVAISQRERGRRFQDKNIQMVARSSLRNRLITAYEEKDSEKIRDAEQALDEWNQDNPLYQIKLKKRDLRKAAKKRGASWLKREETPKGLEWMDEYADQENGQ